MSDGATGLDPRFDPRFQRGYPGQGASETDASSARPAPVPASTPATESRRVPDPPMPIAVTPPVVDDRTPAGTDATDGVDELIRAFQPLDPAGEPEAEETLRPWVIAAWFTLAAFVVIGASLIWTVNNDASFYTGTGRGNPLRDLGWTVGPALVRVGTLGVVVLLTGLGVRRLLAVHGSSQPRPALVRSLEFIGLFAVIAAAIALVVWNTAVVGVERMNGWVGAPDAETIELMALQQVTNILSGAAVEAALWAALGLLALGGISAVRARSARPDRP
ncbi:hypothetical protein ASE14_13600 [Agromyces sp. Root81]|uniref:hypothetical protein n=1 Tax=Agromyces sp. Root81 TaxID=1736601 RepID=UPI0007015832|nr:hypothetical protein [Agromyces sp. Root81]KRC61832.1 hypothetical protein ASE14_13600 [Agromyces sp. Root81]